MNERPLIRDLDGTWRCVKPDVRRQLHSGQPVPEAILPNVIVVTRHQVPGNSREPTHNFDRLCNSHVRKLLFIEDVASQQHRKGCVLNSDFTETSYNFLTCVLE